MFRRDRRGFTAPQLAFALGGLTLLSAPFLDQIFEDRKPMDGCRAALTMEDLHKAETFYMLDFGRTVYYATLSELYQSLLIGKQLSAGRRDGYTLNLTLQKTDFWVTAAPTHPAPGDLTFYIDGSTLPTVATYPAIADASSTPWDTYRVAQGITCVRDGAHDEDEYLYDTSEISDTSDYPGYDDPLADLNDLALILLDEDGREQALALTADPEAAAWIAGAVSGVGDSVDALLDAADGLAWALGEEPGAWDQELTDDLNDALLDVQETDLEESEPAGDTLLRALRVVFAEPS